MWTTLQPGWRQTNSWGPSKAEQHDKPQWLSSPRMSGTGGGFVEFGQAFWKPLYYSSHHSSPRLTKHDLHKPPEPPWYHAREDFQQRCLQETCCNSYTLVLYKKKQNKIGEKTQYSHNDQTWTCSNRRPTRLKIPGLQKLLNKRE